MNDKIDKHFFNITYASAYILALFTFTAFSLSPLHHILLLISGIYFFKLDLSEKRVKLSLSAWSLIGLIIISIVSVIYNISIIDKPLKNIFKLKYFIIPILGIFSYSYWFQKSFSEKKIRLFVNTFLCTTTVASLSGLIGLYSGYNPLRFKAACHATRTCGMYGMYMSYGYGIMLFSLLVIGLFIFRKKMDKYVNQNILYIALFINVIGFYLSYARGALLGFLIALPFFYLRRKKKIFIFATLILVAISSLSYFYVPKIKEVFTSKSRLASNATRISQYKAAFAVFKESPLIGIGYKNFEPLVKEYKRKYKIEHAYFGGHGHSNFFEHLASTGILGLIFLILFHLFWFWESYKRNDHYGDILMPFIVALFISGQFQYSLGDGENLFLVMLIYIFSQIKIKEPGVLESDR